MKKSKLMSSNEEKERQLRRRTRLNSAVWQHRNDLTVASQKPDVSKWWVERSKSSNSANHLSLWAADSGSYLPFCVQAASYFHFKNTPPVFFPASSLIQLLYLSLRKTVLATYGSIWLQCCHGNRLGEANNLEHGLVFRYIYCPS
jgi:hypothetical protein